MFRFEGNHFRNRTDLIYNLITVTLHLILANLDILSTLRQIRDKGTRISYTDCSTVTYVKLYKNHGYVKFSNKVEKLGKPCPEKTVQKKAEKQFCRIV